MQNKLIIIKREIEHIFLHDDFQYDTYTVKKCKNNPFYRSRSDKMCDCLYMCVCTKTSRKQLKRYFKINIHIFKVP